MKKGYDVFGKAFGISLRNDPHDVESIDHKLMQEMLLLDTESSETLYSHVPVVPNMQNHQLYTFANQFRGETDRETIENTLRYCSNIAMHYSVPIEEMLFGGTEAEILSRGTDWCADMARVGIVLLNCCGIPARMVNLVNPEMAYNGHVVVEAFYENKFGICDYIYGYLFHEKAPIDARQLHENREYLAGYPADYQGLYSAIAINDYNPIDKNCYKTSMANEYTLRLINTDHQGKWFMGEDAYN